MNQSATNKTIADILIVDDQINNLRLLSKILSNYDYDVRCAASGETALQIIKRQPPDIILLDISMPFMDGYQVCTELKKDAEISKIPVIFISALGDTFDKVKAFQVGGRDYISKPFEIAEVIARINNQLELKQTQEQLYKLNQQLEDFNTDLEQKVAERTLQLQMEVIQRREAQNKLLYMAMHDPLTNLANRTYLLERLQTCVDIVRQSPDEKFVLLFLGCDRFKLINDSFGRLAGDELLIAISLRLRHFIPQNSLLARSGGDEFTIVLEDVSSTEEALAIVENLQQEFNKPTIFGQREIFINFSVGIVLGTKNYESPEQLMRDADIALHSAKKLGKASYQIFDIQMHQKAVSFLQLETDLQRAVHNKEFVLHYQPIVCLKQNQIVGAEALIRWQHPKKGLIYPDRFISIAEETNLIVAIGFWVMEKACAQLAKWQERSPLASLELEINISVQQLAQHNLNEQIEQIIQATKIQHQKLKLEITESIFMERVTTSQVALEKLQAQGFELILDDFGTGYSSLKYLQKLPISTLKIDRSFVMDLEHNEHNRNIVKATIELSHTLGFSVIAEGIETPKQLAILKSLGCNYGQGYLFSKPLEIEDFEKLVDDSFKL